MSIHRLSFTDSESVQFPAYHPAVSHFLTKNDGNEQLIEEKEGDMSLCSKSRQHGPGTLPSLSHFQSCAVAAFEENSVYYLLEKNWWLRFRENEYDPSLSPIDNSTLLVPGSMDTLKANLQHERDLVLVTPDCWQSFYERYGGGPALMRIIRIENGIASLCSPKAESSPSPANVFQKWSSLEAFEDCGFDLSGKPSRCFVCRRKGPLRCKNCTMVFYCSVNCQKIHWGRHQRWCKIALKHKDLSASAFRKLVGVDRRGLIGMNNMGNTCYLSSGLQCLSHIIPLTSYFLSGEYRNHLNRESRDGTGGLLAEKYELLLRELWLQESTGATAVTPVQVRSEISRKDGVYGGVNQQDAHEFLERFLDWLQEDVNRVGKKPYCERPEGNGENDKALALESWGKDKLRNDSIVNALMGGQMRSQLQCPSCDKKLVRFDYFHTVQLGILYCLAYIHFFRGCKRHDLCFSSFTSQLD